MIDIQCDLELIKQAITNPNADYSPESLNCYSKKQFTLDTDQYTLFKEYKRQLLCKENLSESEQKQLLVLIELETILKSNKLRKYDTKYGYIDNMWLPCAMGLNKCGKDTYIGVYDLTEVYFLILASFLKENISTIKKAVNDLYNSNIDRFNFIALYGSRWISKGKRDMNVLTKINPNFKTYLENCKIKYIKDEVKVFDTYLSNKEFTFEQVVVQSFDFYTNTMFTVIENKILKTLSDKTIGNCTVTDHSKGLNTLVFTSNYKDEFDDVQIKFRNETITIKVLVDIRSKIGMKYLNYKGGSCDE